MHAPETQPLSVSTAVDTAQASLLTRADNLGTYLSATPRFLLRHAAKPTHLQAGVRRALPLAPGGCVSYRLPYTWVAGGSCQASLGAGQQEHHHPLCRRDIHHQLLPLVQHPSCYPMMLCTSAGGSATQEKPTVGATLSLPYFRDSTHPLPCLACCGASATYQGA